MILTGKLLNQEREKNHYENIRVEIRFQVSIFAKNELLIQLLLMRQNAGPCVGVFRGGFAFWRYPEWPVETRFKLDIIDFEKLVEYKHRILSTILQ